jgi:protein-tyrosine phosphatase
MKILMVCLGNICRSPIAEGVMNNLIKAEGLDWEVSSAGTNGYHVGEAPHRFSQKICKHNGIDISAQRARRFCYRDFQNFDIIYVMAADVFDEVTSMTTSAKDKAKVHYFLEPLFPGEKQSVPDPWYGNEDGYTSVYELIQQGCEAILNHLRH